MFYHAIPLLHTAYGATPPSYYGNIALGGLPSRAGWLLNPSDAVGTASGIALQDIDFSLDSISTLGVDGLFYANSTAQPPPAPAGCFYSAQGAWWGIDLGVPTIIAYVALRNPVSALMAGTVVRLGDASPLNYGLVNRVCATPVYYNSSRQATVTCSGRAAVGRYLTLESQGGLFFCEVEAYNTMPSER